jgi:2-dehydropantoate 2-reductase
MRVVVFGAGAVGGHLAARLAAHGSAAGIEVAAVARGAQLEAMNQRGITLWVGEERTSAPIIWSASPVDEAGTRDAYRGCSERSRTGTERERRTACTAA